ncbi:L-Ala-D/L-Glu epimerase [Pantoea sp. 1.19]|uniref:L-Ala-D/L-Glu epimerase n=1 Tax=Pantoea sp. 1.19 TaxID=1925589 RepID=UPI000948AA5A|nr:L-Ala-D/L-Glu epimerase [Pantoea sp. 1.19]
MRTVQVRTERWPLHTPFVIARGSRSEAQVVVVTLTQQGETGSGEATPYARYGESAQSVMAQIAAVEPALREGIGRDVLQQLLPAGAARNAVDSALWELECRLQQQDRWQLLARQAPAEVEMAQTLSIGAPESMAASALAWWEKGVRLLKVKLDAHLITERLVAIRTAVPEATLIVDANESWHSEGLAARCQLLADLGVAMLEQPLPAADDAALANFIHPLPICADESCHTRADLPRLQGRYDMINIKLDKTGGLTEALALAEEATGRGLAVMLGCMICTSRAIRAALPLVSGARFVDFDGPTWLAGDVEPALRFSPGRIALSHAAEQ